MRAFDLALHLLLSMHVTPSLARHHFNQTHCTLFVLAGGERSSDAEEHQDTEEDEEREGGGKFEYIVMQKEGNWVEELMNTQQTHVHSHTYLYVTHTHITHVLAGHMSQSLQAVVDQVNSRGGNVMENLLRMQLVRVSVLFSLCSLSLLANECTEPAAHTAYASECY